MNPIDVVRAKISQFSSFLKENPTPAGYVAPKIANMVSDTIRGTTSPIPTSFQQQPIQAVRNIAAETTGQVINAIPRIGTSMMRISPPGQLYTQAKGYKTPQLQQDIIKQRLNDVYNSFQGIGLATGGASNLVGGVVGVGLGGVSNVMNQKPFFTNTEQNFVQGVLQAAPLAPIGFINPLGRGILNGRYVGLPSQYTIPARATARALKEGFEGAFLGAIEPGEEKNTLKKIKDYALFGAITGAMTQMGGDLTSVMIDRIANSFKVNKDTVLAHIKKANLPVATNETGRDGKRVYRPAWQVYNSKMNIGEPALNTPKSPFVEAKIGGKAAGTGVKATYLPLTQNEGVVGQPTALEKNMSIGGTGVIPEEKIQSFEQQLASSELDDTLRKMYSKDEISVFNRIKAMARSKDVQNGDVEMIYKKNPKLLETAFQSVKEKEPNITSNDEAYQYILDLPTAKDATMPKPPTESFGIGDQVYNAQANPKTLEKIRLRDVKAQERAAKAEFDAWQKQYRETTVSPSQRVKAIEQSIKSNTSSPVSKNPEALKDVSGWQAYMRDVYRNFKAVYGDRFEEAKRVILDPLDRSKGQYVDMTESWAKKLKTDIVDRFNIRKGSKESAAVQQYGEGILSDADLVSQFGEKKAQEIKAADQWFRSAYDELINIVNATRKRIYPNNPEKWVAKRQDYYRHFREMKEGLGALFNIFDSPSNISSTLAGISEGTKPKAKFLSIAQRREGERTTYDAIGGFIDYIKQASYATNIDPHIERFRNLSKELGESTVQSKNLNNFVSYLNRFADDLSGKTNAADRFVQEIIPGGRTTFRAINWLNNRVKSNAVIGNVSSALSQIMNVPQGIADAGVPNSVRGIGRTLAGIFAENPAIKKSTFLRERYSDPFSQFDTGIVNDVGKFAKWMTGVLDKVGSNVIWNSQYEKALKMGVKDAVKFADDATRSLVAGRGIGEVPLLQKARVMQLVAPFQLEVQNLWWVLKDMKDQKAFGKIATFFVVNHLMNKAIEGIRGSDVTFDPIQSMMDGYKSFQEEENKGKGLVKFAGRQAGEVLSNVPFGQTIASLYPEYGATIGDTKLPTRKDLFGKGNPVRQGSGLLAVEGLKDPLYKIIPPYGGAQIKKTIEGLLSVGQGFVGKKDAIKYPVEQSGENIVKGALFGKSALNETRAYYDENRRPLSEKQSQAYFASADKTGTYNKIIEDRKERAQIDKVRDFIRETGKEQIVGDKYIYYDEKTGDVKTIDLSWTVPELKKTGSEALDKKLLSEYKSDITKRQSDIMKLWEAGKVDQSYVMEEYDRLERLKAQFNKPKKITIKKVATPTYKKIRGLKIKRASFGKLKAMPKKKYKFRKTL